MAKPKSNATIMPLPKTSVMRSPMIDVARSGNTSTTAKKGS